jgi:hypothetical protein
MFTGLASTLVKFVAKRDCTYIKDACKLSDHPFSPCLVSKIILLLCKLPKTKPNIRIKLPLMSIQLIGMQICSLYTIIRACCAIKRKWKIAHLKVSGYGKIIKWNAWNVFHRMSLLLRIVLENRSYHSI